MGQSCSTNNAQKTYQDKTQGNNINNDDCSHQLNHHLPEIENNQKKADDKLKVCDQNQPQANTTNNYDYSPKKDMQTIDFNRFKPFYLNEINNFYSNHDILKINHEGTIYLIDNKFNTSRIVRGQIYTSDVFIPRSIKYNSKEYIVISISENAFNNIKNITSIQFPPDSELRIIEKYALNETLITIISIPLHVTKIEEGAFFGCKQLRSVEIPIDSELRTIERNAFALTLIESLFIPASLVELKDGWFNDIENLTKIKIDPRNPRYSYFDGKFIIGKSTESSEDYDVLVFVRRDITEVKIPSFIKIIGSYAISECKKLRRVEIPLDSKLQIIEKYAFNNLSIENISIPSHVTQICECAFLECDQLRYVEIPADSELRVIKKNAFSFTSIERILIPSHVTQIGEGAFLECKQLRYVEIPTDSELRVIEEDAFRSTLIDNFFIPASLVELKDGWCNDIEKLTKIKIDPRNPRYSYYDNKFIIGKSTESSEIYDVIVLARRDITEVKIPSYIKIIGSYAFSKCKKLRRVEIPPDSKLQIIKGCAFYHSSIENILIPSHVTQICECAFYECKKLRRVEIPTDSELQTIEQYAFYCSSIECISIPSHTTRIYKSAFAHCTKIRYVEFSPDSNCQVDEIAFFHTSIESIVIPSERIKIYCHTFLLCPDLQIIEIAEKVDSNDMIQNFLSLKIPIIMIPT